MFAFVIGMGDVYLKKYHVDFQGGKVKIASYTIEGPLFFGVAHAIISKLEIEAEDADIVILNLMNMPVIDSSGAIALKNIKQLLEQDGKRLILAGVKENMLPMLEKLEVLSEEEIGLSTRRIGDVLDRIKLESTNL